jgi:methyl-accepting chemotaxis protein
MSQVSLRVKLTALIGFVAMLLTGAAVFLVVFFPARMDSLASRWAESRASSVANILANSAAAGLDFDDPSSVNEVLGGLHNVPGATYAVAMRADGSVIGTWKAANVPAWARDTGVPLGVQVRDDQLHVVQVIPGKIGNQGRLVLGFSLSELQADKRHNRVVGGTVAAAVFLLGVALSVFIAMTLARPITQLAGMTAEIVQTGDLTRTIELLRSDELGLLASSVGAIVQQQRALLGRLNSLIGGITEVVRRVSAAGKGVTAGALNIQKRVEDTSKAALEMLSSLHGIEHDVDALEHNAENSSASLIEMSSSNTEVVTNVQTMANSAQTTSVAIERMATSIGEIAHNIEQLNATIGETSSSMQRMDGAIEEVERSTKETARLSERVSADADTGVQALEKTLQGIDNIKHSSQSAAQVISNLGARISEIGAILRVIDEVAAQTKLLSLNAAIIAAQAGEHGRGFSVVADQIKELAQRTGASTREISTLILGIQEESRNATAAMDLGVTSVEVGVKLGHEAADALEKIRSSANESTTMIRKIAQATVDQARGSKQITAAIERIAQTVTQISTYSQEQARGADQIISSSKNMNLLTDQVRRSSEEQAQGSKQVIMAIESINNMVVRLSSAQKNQTYGAELVQRAVEEIRSISQGQAHSLSELEAAIASLGEEAITLEAEFKKYKF